MLIFLQAIEPVGGYTTESVTRGQCDARPMFPSWPKSTATVTHLPSCCGEQAELAWVAGYIPGWYTCKWSPVAIPTRLDVV